MRFVYFVKKEVNEGKVSLIDSGGNFVQALNHPFLEGCWEYVSEEEIAASVMCNLDISCVGTSRDLQDENSHERVLKYIQKNSTRTEWPPAAYKQQDEIEMREVARRKRISKIWRFGRKDSSRSNLLEIYGIKI